MDVNTGRSGPGSKEGGAKRQRRDIPTVSFALPEDPTPPTSNSTSAQEEKTVSPLEEALSALKPYIQSLHKGLQPFAEKLLKDLLQSVSNHHWKDKKHSEMTDDTTYVPASCRVGLTLNAMFEVRESKDFKALDARKNSYITEVQQGLSKFAIEAHKLNVNAAREKVFKTYSITLALLAKC